MSAQRDEAYELLALRAVEGLPTPDAARLDELLSRAPELDDGGFERAAAAVDLALTERLAPMPARLREAVEQRGHAWLAERRREAEVLPFRRAPLPEPAVTATTTRWAWIAAAACLALAVAGWWPKLAPTAPPEPRPAPVAATDDALIAPWSATEDPAAAGAAGEVVWSPERQAGVMRIRGLAPNDPATTQYQLWIFDRGRDERYPVDGGVFDMPAAGETVEIPIDAKIPVDEPYLFAITAERPGGVVVSSRERIVLVAEI